MEGCEEYNKTFKTLDCNAYCTVEYGAPKPTDEVSSLAMCMCVCVYVCVCMCVCVSYRYLYEHTHILVIAQGY